MLKKCFPALFQRRESGTHARARSRQINHLLGRFAIMPSMAWPSGPFFNGLLTQPGPKKADNDKQDHPHRGRPAMEQPIHPSVHGLELFGVIDMGEG